MRYSELPKVAFKVTLTYSPVPHTPHENAVREAIRIGLKDQGFDVRGIDVIEDAPALPSGE